MELFLKRIEETTTSTLGDLTYEGLHICYILEDGYNFPKVAEKTRIPSGRYRLGLRTEGGHDTKYKKMFPDFHKGMIELKDVPGFKYILIHIGNSTKDTAGCLLTGKKYFFNTKTKEYELHLSTVAYITAYKKIIELMKQGEVWIIIS